MFNKIKSIILYAASFMIIGGISIMILLPSLSADNIFGIGFSIMLAGMFLWLIMLALIAMGQFDGACCIEDKVYLKMGLIVSILLLGLQIYFRFSYSHFSFLSLPNLIPSYSSLEQNELWLIIANYVLSFLLGYCIFSMLYEKALYDSFTVLGYIIVGFVSSFIPIVLINSPLLILVVFFYFLYKEDGVDVRKCIISGIISIVLIIGSVSFGFINYNLPIYANFQYEYNEELDTFDIISIKNVSKFDRVSIPNKYFGKSVRIKNTSLFDQKLVLEYVKCPTWAYDNLPGAKKIEFTSGNIIENSGKETNEYLIEVILPKELKIIEENAFRNCSSLTNIEIPENVTTIGENAFLGCSSLTSIVIPEGVTKIDSNAFYNCSSLTSIVIPESVTIIGNSVFEGCKSLEYNNYENALYLGNKDNPYLVLVKSLSCDVKKVVISRDTRFICDSAFHYTYYEYLNNKVLLEEVVFEEGSKLEFIGENAFSGCIYLKEIILPSSLKEISAGAFYNCESLVSLEIPEGVKYLPKNLITGKSFRFILVPASVNRISINVFGDDNKYIGVYYYGSSSHWEQVLIDKESSDRDKVLKIFVYYHYDFFDEPNVYWVKDGNEVILRQYNEPKTNQ